MASEPIEVDPAAVTKGPAEPKTPWDDALFVDTAALRERLATHAENFTQPDPEQPDAAGPAQPPRRPVAWDVPRNDPALGDIVRFTQGIVPLELPRPGDESTVSGTMMDWHVLLRPPNEENESTFASALPIDRRIALLDRHWDLLVSLLVPTLSPDPDAHLAMPRPAHSERIAADWAPRDATLTELMWLRSDASAMDRYQYSYGVVLLWFGWRLHDGTTGEIDRHREWRGRYDALERTEVAEVSRRVVRVVRSLLFVGARTFADKLMHFVSKELREGRLQRFRAEFEQTWLPLASAVRPTVGSGEGGMRYVAEWTASRTRYTALVHHAVDSSDSE